MHKVVNLETKCAILRNLVIWLSKNFNSWASNQMVPNNSRQGKLKEEYIVQQIFEAMEIGEHELLVHDQGLDEATGYNIF
jgi:hypothetical protein